MKTRAIFRPEAGCHHQPQGCSKMSSSKATAIFAYGASWQYVSTEQWRERRWRLFSTGPFSIFLSILPCAMSLRVVPSSGSSEF